MHEVGKYYYCTRNLHMDNGELVFKKGKCYLFDSYTNGQVWFIDEQGHEHGVHDPDYLEDLSKSWIKYFTNRTKKLERILGCEDM